MAAVSLSDGVGGVGVASNHPANPTDPMANPLAAAEEEEESAATNDPSQEGLRRLCWALYGSEALDGSGGSGQLEGSLRAAASLVELDASSGALAQPGSARLLLAPLLASPHCALRLLSACNLTRAGLHTIASALRTNHSLTTLDLQSNMIFGVTTERLVFALERHPRLTSLSLNHNPLLDAGGSLLASILPSSRLTHLQLAFTGVADRTCEALSLSLASETCVLRAIKLTGNQITTSGVIALAACMGGLRIIDLTANTLMDSGGAMALAKSLPTSQLHTLRLAGCKVDKKGCSKLATALTQSPVTSLDLSCNHFGSAGSDEFSFVLTECAQLTALNLSDCDLDDEAADELLETLTDASDALSLCSLDLRWNKLSAPKHSGGRGISADARVDTSSQKQQSAADRQSAHLERTWQEAKASGKKVYVPKWAREQQKAQAAAQKKTGGTGSGMA